MSGNSFGNIFKLTSFGESHGEAIGGIVEGCPPGLKLDFKFIQKELNRRRPGQSFISTQRQEEDQVEFLSGILDGKTTGTPIGFIIRNKNQRAKDYSKIMEVYRPGHADYVYEAKYGLRDYRGGGRSSARETACRVVAGAIAKLYLKKEKISFQAFVKQIGHISLPHNYNSYSLKDIEKNIVRCPDKMIAKKMIVHIEELMQKGDSCGGIIQCVIHNVPTGLGEPVFNKLHAELGKAMLSINAVKGFEIGSGFESVTLKGSEMNDVFHKKAGKIETITNYSGGIQGGISNGMPIYFNVAFKPVSSIKTIQKSVDNKGKSVTLKIEGRHDPCVVPRAVPIVESMAALVIVDFLLLNRTIQ